MTKSIPVLARAITTVVAMIATAIIWLKGESYFATVFGLTAAWSILSFLVLELLVKSTLLAPGEKRNITSISLLAVAKIGLYGVALWAIFSVKLPPYACIAGFSLLMVSIIIAGLVSGRSPQSVLTVGQDNNE